MTQALRALPKSKPKPLKTKRPERKPPPRYQGLRVRFKLHPKQSQLFTTKAREVLYGGAAGGGKSHVARVCAIAWALQIPGLQIYFFRRHYKDLIKNHIEGPTGFAAMLAPLVLEGSVKISKLEIQFSNGSKIYLNHCEHDKDRFNYHGTEMHVLFIEEATQFPEKVIRYFRSRVRMPEAVKATIPEPLQHCFPRIVYTSNPGGKGHSYFKRIFIEKRTPFEVYQAADEEGGFSQQFIPAFLSDNPSLNEAEYTKTLKGVGSEKYVRMLLLGDWNVPSGSFFSNLGSKHFLYNFKVPDHWERLVGFDWGRSTPFCVLWAAVSSGKDDEGNEIEIPKGALVFYREWYGWSGVPDEGLKLNPDVVAAGILERTGGERIGQWVADPSIFNANTGPAISETFRVGGIPFRRGDNSRVPGWQQLHSRMDSDPGGFYILANACPQLIRTADGLEYDDKREDDLDTTGEDHPWDAARYIAMARPVTKDYRGVKKVRSMKEMSIDDLISANRSPRARI